MNEFKTKENRVRRACARAGLLLRKSRGRISGDNRGQYMVLNERTGSPGGRRTLRRFARCHRRTSDTALDIGDSDVRGDPRFEKIVASVAPRE